MKCDTMGIKRGTGLCGDAESNIRQIKGDSIVLRITNV